MSASQSRHAGGVRTETLVYFAWFFYGAFFHCGRGFLGDAHFRYLLFAQGMYRRSSHAVSPNVDHCTKPIPEKKTKETILGIFIFFILMLLFGASHQISKRLAALFKRQVEVL